MTPSKIFTPTARWTTTLDYERQQEHDFSNLLAELAYAIRRQDEMIIEYCESELKRMYRDRRQRGS